MGKQRDYVLHMLKPIAKKCLGLVCGNHEKVAEKFYDRALYGEIVAGIARYADKDPSELILTTGGFVVMRFQRKVGKSDGDRWPFSVYCHHGYGGGRLAGGHALTLERALGDVDADVIFMGHRHTRSIAEKIIISAGAGNRQHKTRYRLAAFIGGYLGAYVNPGKRGATDTYAERIGLPPKHLGTSPLMIKPSKREFVLYTGNMEGLD